MVLPDTGPAHRASWGKGLCASSHSQDEDKLGLCLLALGTAVLGLI